MWLLEAIVMVNFPTLQCGKASKLMVCDLCACIHHVLTTMQWYQIQSQNFQIQKACKYFMKKQPQIFLAIFSGSFYFIHFIYSKVKLIIVYSKKSSYYIFHSLFSSYLESRTKTSEKHLFVFFLAISKNSAHFDLVQYLFVSQMFININSKPKTT